jgi:multidrug efflux pump subunit AcrA (membrane-fusion protein)
MFYWGVITTVAFFLMGCGGHTTHKKSEAKTYVVKAETVYKTLYFTGTVKPLREYTITSPMEAVVETMHFHYGQHVKKDQVVFTLNSAELQKQYNETLTEYLKAKDSYTIARSKFTGTEDLWESGLLAKNNYLSEKSNLNTARVNLMQSAGKLSELLEKMGDRLHQNFTQLSFSEFDKVRLALAGKHNLIELKSPGDGVLLYPPKANDDKTGRITVGSSTKAGEVIGLIGDMSGIGLEIDVPEVDIDKIKLGMPATIHGVAFAKQELKGELLVINPQASTSAGGSLPSFTAIVEVKALTPNQRGLVKVGMSASIELSAESSDKLLVPISAVKQKKGQSIVRVVSSKGVVSDRVVVTGAVSADKVDIESGLKTSDVVLYD